MKNLYSVGYGSFKIDEYLDLLEAYGIDILIDTRERPISRKPGFAKTKLGLALAERNIAYVHFRDLGSPSAARTSLREDGDYEQFFTSVRDHLNLRAGAAISEVASLFRQYERMCLMCICPDVLRCHRSIVLEMLAQEIRFKPVELTLKMKIAA